MPRVFLSFRYFPSFYYSKKFLRRIRQACDSHSGADRRLLSCCHAVMLYNSWRMGFSSRDTDS
jgi:hypothetical protein